MAWSLKQKWNQFIAFINSHKVENDFDFDIEGVTTDNTSNSWETNEGKNNEELVNKSLVNNLSFIAAFYDSKIAKYTGWIPEQVRPKDDTGKIIFVFGLSAIVVFFIVKIFK